MRIGIVIFEHEKYPVLHYKMKPQHGRPDFGMINERSGLITYNLGAVPYDWIMFI